MAKIFLFYTIGDSNEDIEVYQKAGGTITVISASRDCFTTLQKMEETKSSGIYILMKENARYVGKATDIRRRLTSHQENKEWWDRVIFFTKVEGGQLDEAQLLYLEEKLISEFQELGYNLENKQSGSRSNIIGVSRFVANGVLESFKDLTENYMKINLFKKAPRKRKVSLKDSQLSPVLDNIVNVSTELDNIVNESNSLTSITSEVISVANDTAEEIINSESKNRVGKTAMKKLTDSTGITIESTTWKNLYVNYLIENREYFSSLKDNSVIVLKDLKEYSEIEDEKLKSRYCSISEDYFAYINYSAEAVKSKLYKIASFLNRTILITENSSSS